MRSERRIGGFTLIELMITVAIIAVLTMIALPSYQAYVRKANRSAAQSFMVVVAAREEQILLDQRCYVAVSGNNNFAVAPMNSPVPADVAARYDFAVVVPAGACPTQYSVTAAAKGSQVPDGDLGDLVLTSAGVKTPLAKWQ